MIQEKVIHLLKAGLPLCGFTTRLTPKDWPTNHYWVSINDNSRWSKVNCPDCTKKLETLRPPTASNQ